MQLHLVSHLGLLERPPASHGEQLLLEGEWPAPLAENRYSLNGCVTRTYAWIDERVDELHAQLLDATAGASPTPQELRPEFLLALELRYYLVKLARFAAVVREFLRSGSFTEVNLWCSAGRDEDYADLTRQLCLAHGTRLKTIDGQVSTHGSASMPQASERRRLAGLRHAARRPVDWARAACASAERISGTSPPAGSNRPIVLCGAPAHLGPLLAPLCSRSDAPVYWLCDTLALRQYAKWRPRGVRFLVCDDPCKGIDRDRFNAWGRRAVSSAGHLSFCDIDLGPTVRRWLRRQWERGGPRLARCRAQMEEHFRRIGARWLLVDEDATPLKRLAVAVARQSGVRSAVVQHGAPYVRYGFAPLAADVLFAWGELSRRQFQHWGVPDDRVRVTGSPKHDLLCAAAHTVAPPKRRRRRSRQWLLFASVHHSDDRPDVVSFQFTAATNAEMVRMVLRALRSFPDSKLVIKLHPRTTDAAFFTALVAEFPELAGRVRVVRGGKNHRRVRRAACVLSCASSAGIEAMLSGAPVIQLMPAGSEELVDPDDWRFAGTARTQQQLDACLEAVLSGSLASPPLDELGDVFANLQRPAGPQIAEALCSEQSVAHHTKPRRRSPLTPSAHAAEVPS